MRVLDPLLFLTGHRGAIERIAATRHAWIVGAILVLSAGIARNYDHLDLLRNPEWIIGPFGASLFSIVFIFLCIEHPLKLFAVGALKKQLGTFLVFAWMTAPCAWLYGIPVESHTDLITATKWNIAFLAIVALWRVFLMMRAVAVLTGVTNLRAFVLVLAPAAFESMVGSTLKGMSLVGIMGGVRLPPHTQLLRDASQFVAGASFWIFIAMVVLCWIVKGRATQPLSRAETGSPWVATAMAIVALGLWTAVAVPFHPLTANQHQLKSLIDQRQYAEAVNFASGRQRANFLPNHDFPSGYFPLDLLKSTTADTPSWLKQEWTSAAIENLKGVMGLVTLRGDGRQEIEHRFPEILREVHAHAAELRTRESKLTHDERAWLSNYKYIFEPQSPPDRVDPTEAPLPEK